MPLPFYVHAETVIQPFIHVRTHARNCRILVIVQTSGKVSGMTLPAGVPFERALEHFRITPGAA